MQQEGSAYTKFICFFQAVARNTKFYEGICGEHREKIEEILTEFQQRKENSAFYSPIVIHRFYLYFSKVHHAFSLLCRDGDWGRKS